MAGHSTGRASVRALVLRCAQTPRRQALVPAHSLSCGWPGTDPQRFWSHRWLGKVAADGCLPVILKTVLNAVPCPCFFSLRDTLVSYMETKDSEIPPEMESQFPEELLLCNCVSVWKRAAGLKQSRQTR